MILRGRVESAQVGVFGDAVDLVVSDREVVSPRGERPQYRVRLIGGWPGLEELREFQKEVRSGRRSREELLQMAQQIRLPEEERLLGLEVVDKRTKGFLQLVAIVVEG